MFIPREFPKWDKSVDGLENGWKWVMDYERSCLPAGLVFPRGGQIWEALRKCAVSYRAYVDQDPPGLNQLLTSAKDLKTKKPSPRPDFGPYLKQFGTAVLQPGEKVRILDLSDPKPITITFVPVRYHELQSIIPAKVRALPGYRGRYELSAKIAKTIADFQLTGRQTFFSESFRLVEEAGASQGQ